MRLMFEWLSYQRWIEKLSEDNAKRPCVNSTYGTESLNCVVPRIRYCRATVLSILSSGWNSNEPEAIRSAAAGQLNIGASPLSMHHRQILSVLNTLSLLKPVQDTKIIYLECKNDRVNLRFNLTSCGVVVRTNGKSQNSVRWNKRLQNKQGNTNSI